MKNKLVDLNNHLFAQIERMSVEKLSGDKLKEEISRSKSITDISKEIVSNASLQLDALKLKAEYKGLKTNEVPTLFLENKSEG